MATDATAAATDTMTKQTAIFNFSLYSQQQLKTTTTVKAKIKNSSTTQTTSKWARKKEHKKMKTAKTTKI